MKVRFSIFSLNEFIYQTDCEYLDSWKHNESPTNIIERSGMKPDGRYHPTETDRSPPPMETLVAEWIVSQRWHNTSRV